MRAVFKYTLQLLKWQTIAIPVGGKILCIDAQSNEPCMWVEVDTFETNRILVSIELYCTGESFSDANREYLGTFQIEAGAYVYHVYKVL